METTLKAKPCPTEPLTMTLREVLATKLWWTLAELYEALEIDGVTQPQMGTYLGWNALSGNDLASYLCDGQPLSRVQNISVAARVRPEWVAEYRRTHPHRVAPDVAPAPAKPRDLLAEVASVSGESENDLADLAKAARSYWAILGRCNSPAEPGDAERLAAAMATIGIDVARAVIDRELVRRMIQISRELDRGNVGALGASTM
jgi:hypothetical protein